MYHPEFCSGSGAEVQLKFLWGLCNTPAVIANGAIPNAFGRSRPDTGREQSPISMGMATTSRRCGTMTSLK